MRNAFGVAGAAPGARAPSPSDDPRREPRHVTLQRVGHERQGDQHGDEDREDLGHEDQRHFLDLGERLEQRDDDADHQPDQHQGARHQDERDDRVARHVENFRTGHGSAPTIVRSAFS